MSRRNSNEHNKRQPLLLPSQRARQSAAPENAQKQKGAKTASNSAGASIACSGNSDDATQREPRSTQEHSTTQEHGSTQEHRSTQKCGDTQEYRGTQAERTAPQADHLPATNRPLPLGKGVRLVAYHPCGLYVLDKPEGILSHPNKKTEINRSLIVAPYSLQEECFYDLYSGAAGSTKESTEGHGGSTQENAGAYTSDETKDIHGDEIKKITRTHHSDETPPERLYLLHRLDSATSGLLLLADNEALADSVRAAFAGNGVRKTYLALCVATRTPMRPRQKGRWSDRLQREHSGEGGSVVHVRASGSGMSAITDFICLKTAPHNQSLALLELHPVSGRTHQLRVHCAQHNLPIIGDGKYGDFRLNRAIAKGNGYKRLFLHAAALELAFTFKGKALRLRFVSPPPPEFDALLHNAPALAPARGGNNSAPHRNGRTGAKRGSGTTGRAGKGTADKGNSAGNPKPTTSRPRKRR